MPRMAAGRSWQSAINRCRSWACNSIPKASLPSTGTTCFAPSWRCRVMLSVDQALKLVLDHAEPLPPRVVDLPDAVGCILAEQVISDIDSPPHDKAIVDGYAVVAA